MTVPLRLDPDAAAFLERLRAAGLPKSETLAPATARELMKRLRAQPLSEVEPVESVRDLLADGVPARLYRPGNGTLALILFMHGGGWVLGDLDTHDAFCRQMANASGCAVLAVDYRLAPEHPFPAALEDSAALLKWAAANALDIGIDARRVAVMGDSAGGNLAAVLALMSAAGALPALRLQVLLYPVVDASLRFPSQSIELDGLAFDGATMRWFRDNYVQTNNPADWRISPLEAPSLAGLPACILVTCGVDPLCDEGLAYAARLAGYGVRLEHHHFPGQLHGFAAAGAAVPTGVSAVQRIAAAIAETMAKG